MMAKKPSVPTKRGSTAGRTRDLAAKTDRAPKKPAKAADKLVTKPAVRTWHTISRAWDMAEPKRIDLTDSDLLALRKWAVETVFANWDVGMDYIIEGLQRAELLLKYAAGDCVPTMASAPPRGSDETG